MDGVDGAMRTIAWAKAQEGTRLIFRFLASPETKVNSHAAPKILVVTECF